MGYQGLIGKTPMVKLRSLSAATGCDILVKVGLTFELRGFCFPWILPLNYLAGRPGSSEVPCNLWHVGT